MPPELTELEVLKQENARLRDALRGVLNLIDKAGLHNLTNGVQLGQTVWFVKMSDAITYAQEALKSPHDGKE